MVKMENKKESKLGRIAKGAPSLLANAVKYLVYSSTLIFNAPFRDVQEIENGQTQSYESIVNYMRGR